MSYETPFDVLYVLQIVDYCNNIKEPLNCVLYYKFVVTGLTLLT